MLKKISLALAIVFICAQFTVVFAVDINVPKGKPTLDGVISPGEWPESGKYVMDKDCILKYNGVYPDTSDMTDSRGVITYLMWDDGGLYVATDIKDNTPTFTESWDAHGQDEGVKSDMYQIVLWAQDEAKWMDIAIYKDGTLAPRGHENVDDPLDNNLTGKMTGKGTLKPDGSGYYMECFIPWDVVYVQADYKEGLKIPVMFMYVDMDGEDQIFYKTVDVDIWPPSDEIDNFLILGAPYSAPAAEQPAEAADVAPADQGEQNTPAAVDTPAPAPTPVSTPAPATGDGTVFMLLVGFASICGAILIYKNKNLLIW